MFQFFALFALLSSLLVGQTPPTAKIVPNNGDEAVNVWSFTSDPSDLSYHEIERGAHIGIFELQCSVDGSSPIDGHTVTTSGGGYATGINVADCINLQAEEGAAFQLIEMPGFEMDLECNADCELQVLYSQFESGGLVEEIGTIQVVPIGPNPVLLVVGK